MIQIGCKRRSFIYVNSSLGREEMKTKTAILISLRNKYIIEAKTKYNLTFSNLQKVNLKRVIAVNG